MILITDCFIAASCAERKFSQPRPIFDSAISVCRKDSGRSVGSRESHTSHPGNAHQNTVLSCYRCLSLRKMSPTP